MVVTRAMSRGLLAVAFLAIASSQLCAGVYLIGNSLTYDMNPWRLDNGPLYHIDCGVGLPVIYDRGVNGIAPCVTPGIDANALYWPVALPNTQYNMLSVQPHTGTMLENVNVISQWMAMQPNAVLLLHTGWTASDTMISSYNTPFVDADDAEMNWSPGFYEALIGRLHAIDPERVILTTRSNELLAKVDADITAGLAPYTNLNQLYRDIVHMNPHGQYLMHNALRRALGQPASAVGFESVPLANRQYLDSVLASVPESGAGVLGSAVTVLVGLGWCVHRRRSRCGSVV